MKLTFTFIFSLFFLGIIFAQKRKDSLFEIWHTETLHDSIRFESMTNLIEDYYLFTKTDSALVLGKQMLDLAKKKNSNRFQIDANILMGKAYRSGDLYLKYDDYINAFKSLQKSQKHYRELGDRLNEGWSATYQGFIFQTLGDFKEAEKHHLEHLRLSEKYGIKRSISGANGNLANVYSKMGDIPKSIKHWKEAIRISKEIGLEEYATVGTGYLLSLYIKEKQYAEAVKYLNEYKTVTAQFATPKYSRNFSMDIHLWQCQIDYGLKKYNKALKECEACLKIYESNNWNPESNLLKSLYEINKKLNRPAIALDFYEKYQVLINDKKEDKARTEIQNIIFNNQLVADSIAQAQEKELLNITYEEGLRKKNREKNLFLIIGLLVLLIAGAYFLISRRITANESKRLKEINQLKNALFTNITHEFRTPLTVIKGMTSNIKSDLNNQQTDHLEKAVEIIDRNSDSLLNLINEMLDLAKIESGHVELNLVQIDSIPFTKYLTQSFQSLAEDKHIDFSVNCELERLNMDLDVNKFTAIVTNLISNAIKFTAQHGKVEVFIEKVQKKHAPCFYFKVKDSGLGISKEDQQHVFDKFYQVDDSSSKLEKGSGIGLALAKEFVELMHGSIHVESTLRKGSVFSVKIPITNDANQLDDSELITTSTVSKFNNESILVDDNLFSNTPNKNHPLVLIVEDNRDVAHYIKTCLQGNYQILHAPNGSIGIEMALEKIPDIIISDVMMPEKDGFEVCELLKTDELTNHIPIIMLTAKATFEDRLTGLSHGADAYLTKPFKKEELLTRIDQLILLRKTMLNKFEKTGIDRLLNKNIKNSETKFLNKIITAIHDNITQAEFGPLELAIQLGLSESQLYRKLKATSGKSTALFIRSIRLQKGKELLQTTNKIISEIAYDVGFNDPSYFSRAFKKEFGNAPSAISK
ncbi:response regulator [uncultured Algibacter sp.]|uniref:response regulator n=1 Tax=uncultured Algibacter sp. TaxID=298659 RepID=UPI00262023FA|nr:response regulator [uncultured Algibacter sp.]